MALKGPERVLHQARAERCALETCHEDELREALRGGNPEAFTVLFKRYYRLVLVTALRILGDSGEAEDVAQTVFFEVYRKAQQFDPTKGSLKNWILQYAYHRSINRKNYLKLRYFYNHADKQANRGEELWATEVAAPRQDLALLVAEFLALLNGRQRRVLEMVFFEGLTLKEIADTTGQSFANVRHHYYRGLDRLRDRLSVRRDARAQQEPTGALAKVSSANP